MLSTWVVFAIISGFWLGVGAIGPWLVPKGYYKGVYQTMIVTTAVCCWLHWFITYCSQINPLIGPQLTNGMIYMMMWVWD